MTNWSRAAFQPARVAIVDASEEEETVGEVLMRNLIAHFGGEVMPVHPQRTTVFGGPWLRPSLALQLLADAGLPVAPFAVARDPRETPATARNLGFPVVGQLPGRAVRRRGSTDDAG